VTPDVARARRRRWVVVAAGAAALVLVAVLGPPAPGSARADGRGAAELLRRAAASAAVAHEGEVLSTGAVGLPDLPRLTGVADLLGTSTRTRVWWAGPDGWRVDALTSTGEQGTYAGAGRLTTWDYASAQLVRAPGASGPRLPRTADLLPPVLARGLLSGDGALEAAAAQAEALPPARVAGRVADGVRVPAADARSTLSAADLWVDRATGLPLRVALLDAAGTAVLTSEFDVLHVGAPDPGALAPPAPPGVLAQQAPPDLAQEADARSPWQLPPVLAGLPVTGGTAALEGAGVAAYGARLTRLAVVPLPLREGRRAVGVARDAGALELPTADYYAEAVLLRAGPLAFALIDAGDGAHAYLVAGTVTQEVLQAAVDQLLDDPLPRRADS